MEETEALECCLCGDEITVDPVSGWDKGHNAQPLYEGRCCNNCNDIVVLARICALKKGWTQ